MMKTALLAAAAVLASASAYAGVITAGVTDDGAAVALVCVGGVNSPLTCQGSSTHFSSINIGALGEPDLPGADLSSVTIDASSRVGFAGNHVLGINVLQSGLNFATDGTATSTLTVNNLVGGPFGPSTLATAVNGATLFSHTFPATTINDTKLSSDAVPALITSDAHSYAITFTAGGQSVTDTIQLVVGSIAVPEPMSLAILGSGLIGLGLLRRRHA